MVISKKYKIVFVEVPRTGSEAIRQELLENYSGESFKNKHTLYRKSFGFNDYSFVLGISNPLEREYSKYSKFKYRPLSYFKFDGKLWIIQYITLFFNSLYWVLVNKFNISFVSYLRLNYFLPYVDPRHFHDIDEAYLLKKENLSGDFYQLLDSLNIERIRDLPKVNKTKKDKYELDYSNGMIKYLFNIELQNGGYEHDEFKSVLSEQITRWLYKLSYILNRTKWRLVR